ncbi:MAG: hypothetical protein H7Y41_03850 [Hyphomonadaceae bacterium]|nr:hypothetical protein [Clostridia bacterium]
MEWIILFAMMWILFFTLIDWKAFKVNVWGGLFTVGMQTFVDSQLILHKLYVIHNPMIDILGTSLFFVAGPVFVIGVLFAQFHPVKRWAVAGHLIVITTMFSSMEYLLTKRNALEYINWHQIDSVGVNVAAMGLLSWFCMTILGKRMG